MDSRFSRVENNYFDCPVPVRTLATVMANQKEYHKGCVPVSSAPCSIYYLHIFLPQHCYYVQLESKHNYLIIM
jgi:hypothetical protein